MKKLRSLLPATLAVTLLLSACVGKPETSPRIDLSSQEMRKLIKENRLTDKRGRFREIFCTLLQDHGESLPDYIPCDGALTSVDVEQGATAKPVPLGLSREDFLFLFVPGLGWNCFEDWLAPSYSSPKHIRQFGYEIRMVPVDGLSSTTSNARMIDEYVASMSPAEADRPLILAGYSKGAPDILEAIVAYPDLAKRVVAVVSLAGAVRGSPLANDATQADANMLTMVPGSKCEKEHGDNEAVASLRTDVRQKWLAEHALPAHIHYYSVITLPDPDRVSFALRSSYRLLSQDEPLNDSQITIFDQIIPGSTLIAFLNADHWALAVPIARKHPLIGSSLVNHNDYPRETFLEALLRFLEEDLDSRALTDTSSR